MFNKIPYEGIWTLVRHEIAMRLTGTLGFRPDSRVVIASVPNGFGEDFSFILGAGLAQVVGNSGQMPDEIGRTDIVYKPYTNQGSEPDESLMIQPYAPAMIHAGEQTRLEKRLASLVLSDSNDDLNRIRFFPGGKLNFHSLKQVDFEVIASALHLFYADDATIIERLQRYKTSRLCVEPLQVRLYKLRIWGENGNIDVDVKDLFAPGVHKNYLGEIPP